MFEQTKIILAILFCYSCLIDTLKTHTNKFHDTSDPWNIVFGSFQPNKTLIKYFEPFFFVLSERLHTTLFVVIILMNQALVLEPDMRSIVKIHNANFTTSSRQG